MKRINRKTVETRLSFATAFSSPHPFVAFALSESLGTRLIYTHVLIPVEGLMFLVKSEIAVLLKQLFLVLLEADITAAVEHAV